jgi:PAS domain S-box-containing protein
MAFIGRLRARRPCLSRLPLLWTLCLLVAGTLTGLAQEGGDPSAPILSASEVDYPPFCIVGDDGVATGFSVELMEAALGAMGRSVTFRTGTWDEVKGWLARGEIEALPLVGRTPEREELFDFSFPYMSLHGAIVVRSDTTDIRELGDLIGRQVAVMKGDNAEEFLRREDRGIIIHTTPTFETALQELSEGRHDAVVIQRLVALRLIDEIGLANLRVINAPVEGFRQDFCFAVTQGDRETLALLNEGLAVVIADGTYRHLHSKWFAALELPQNRPLVFGGDHNFPPYEYLDEQGRPAGYNVELTRALAREKDLDIEIRLGPWPEMREKLARGEIDALQGMFYSLERDLSFDFTPPHVAINYVAVARAGGGPPPGTAEELVGRRIVVQQGDFMHDFVIETSIEAEVAAVDSQERALQELVEGRHDFALVARNTARFLIEKHGWQNLVVGQRPLQTLDYCYAVPEGRTALLSQLTDGLHMLEDSGEYRRIYTEWMGVYEPAPQTFLEIIRQVAVVIVPLLVLLLLFSLWSWSLRRQVEVRTRELRSNEALLTEIIDAIVAPLFYKDTEGLYIGCNRAFSDFLGLPKEQIIGRTVKDVAPERPSRLYAAADLAVMETGEAQIYEAPVVFRDGTLRQAVFHKAPFRGPDGTVGGLVGAMLDITERKQAEEELRQSTELQRAIIACSPLAIFSIDVEGRVLSWNESAEEMFGWSAEEVIGEPLPIVPEELKGEFEALRRAVLAGDTLSGVELLRQSKSGDFIDVSLSAAPIEDADGNVAAIMASLEDITERKAVEQQVREFKAIFDNANFGAVIAETDGTLTYVNACCAEMHGYRPEELVGRHLSELHNEEQREDAEQLQRLLIEEGSFDAREVWHVHRDGTAFPLLMTGMLTRDADGAPHHMALTAIDIRELKQVQSQLQQIQKLDAVGRLAGGVAHDFNNMLSVIIGRTELLKMEQDLPEAAMEELEEIDLAARRSADLTRQLLAFARRQTMSPRPLELNDTVESMLTLLRRLIGEDIDLAWLPAHGLWPVRLDPAQVDQMLANLCVNARDAIEGVGKVTIETANMVFDEAYCATHPEFIPGEYVMLAVSDDGRGMDEETLARVFEPFFTTKGATKGTGLGLATVYGIVRQNDGFINVYSEPGGGTTFRIYIPRHAGDVEPAARPEKEEVPRSTGEVVLLVEDDPAILSLGETMLEQLGYQVRAVATTAEAIDAAEEYDGAIDLLITDVVMPEMNGRELADYLQRGRPEMKVLYMSGYTANVIAHRGVLEEGLRFMQKPFSLGELARKISAVLDDSEG